MRKAFENSTFCVDREFDGDNYMVMAMMVMMVVMMIMVMMMMMITI